MIRSSGGEFRQELGSGGRDDTLVGRWLEPVRAGCLPLARQTRGAAEPGTGRRLTRYPVFLSTSWPGTRLIDSHQRRVRASGMPCGRATRLSRAPVPRGPHPHACYQTVYSDLSAESSAAFRFSYPLPHGSLREPWHHCLRPRSVGKMCVLRSPDRCAPGAADGEDRSCDRGIRVAIIPSGQYSGVLFPSSALNTVSSQPWLKYRNNPVVFSCWQSCPAAAACRLNFMVCASARWPVISTHSSCVWQLWAILV